MAMSRSPLLAAEAQAAKAARRSDVDVRELTLDSEFRAAEQLLCDIWSVGPGQSPLAREVLRVLSFSGAYAAGAYRGEKLLGVAVGLLADDRHTGGGVHLHSHITGVAREAQGSHVGFALKLHQGAWALRRNIDLISWTFDPLVSRNAHFNIQKLGATAPRYYVDFYGEMSDGVNSGWGSDRLLIEWRPAEHRANASSPVGEEPVEAVLDHDADQIPLLRWSGNSKLIACRLPENIDALRQDRPDVAIAWRHAVRKTLQRALKEDFWISGFDRRFGYILRRPHTS
ncbi:GNAT family N-acetyltransferase [Streptomyces sp. NPDC008343]|uniref:GNAT family N-acetyltransferase n=1 Tax=Streptomyces sp. NPDC008343 TaxID=3364828 RepID=UPI0036EF5943